MAEAVPRGPCELCDGTGEWAGGCDIPDACWQCHGTGVARVRGNCEACLGYGWSYGPHRCEHCHETGWIDADVALYWCGECLRTRAAPTSAPTCGHDDSHVLERVSGERPG